MRVGFPPQQLFEKRVSYYLYTILYDVQAWSLGAIFCTDEYIVRLSHVNNTHTFLTRLRSQDARSTLSRLSRVYYVVHFGFVT